MRTRRPPPRLPRRLPAALRGSLEVPDSSTAGGRSLVSCFHVILSETGRGDGFRSLSARTTTPASPVGERQGRRRLDGGETWGVASLGPRPPCLSLLGASCCLGLSESGLRAAQLHLSRQPAGAGGPRTLASHRRALGMVALGSVTRRLGSVFPFLLVLVDLQYEGEPCPDLARGAGSGVGRPRRFLASVRARVSRRLGRWGESRGLRGRAWA